jgi:hypothetical protein
MNRYRSRSCRRSVIQGDKLPQEFVQLLHDPSARCRVNELVAALPPPQAQFVRRCFGIGMNAPGSWVLAATFLDLSRAQALDALRAVYFKHARQETVEGVAA